MDSGTGCHCGFVKDEGPPLIFACSGAADVGELTDRVARRLARERVARMYCTSAIGGAVEEYLNNTEAARRIFLLDGCAHHCTRRVLEGAGFYEFDHICLSDFGYDKGHSPASGVNIDAVVMLCKEKLLISERDS